MVLCQKKVKFMDKYSEISCSVKVIHLFAHIFSLLAKNSFTLQVILFEQDNFWRKTVIHKRTSRTR